jgi:hypothetical protein
MERVVALHFDPKVHKNMRRVKYEHEKFAKCALERKP